MGAWVFNESLKLGREGQKIKIIKYSNLEAELNHGSI